MTDMIREKGASVKKHKDVSAERKRKILVVEDEFVNREILTAYLNSEYTVVCAETGAEAKKALYSEPDISLVLLDLILPDVHGLDLLRMIKQNAKISKIPVIVMTSDKQSEVESLNNGAIDFISKPYPLPDVVKARIRRTIELSEDRDLIQGTERDHLTGLYNREYFFFYVEQYDAYHKDDIMDALVLDVNHFQMINERFGKVYADGVLKRIGQKILDITESRGGIACRKGADTFLIYCPHLDDYSGLMKKVVSAACGEDKGRIRIRLGAYANADKTTEAEVRFDRAKIAADTIRDNYAVSVALYDNALHETEVFGERLLDEFQNAIDTKQFVVYFQPKFDIRRQKPALCGAEALVRWKHPSLGMISPGVFIPLFEKNGLIRKLDDYVWRETARALKRWKDTIGNIVPVSVNVSRIDIMDPDVVDTLAGIVKEVGLDFGDLHLEITESAYTENADRIVDAVYELRELGFVIEMDDFGSGYSSLSMISTMPIDVLKLDMIFIRNVFKENGNIRMLKVIAELADFLSVPMIAEGVETEEQMLALKAMGCDMVQGYYFARPMPSEDFEKYLVERKNERGKMKC